VDISALRCILLSVSFRCLDPTNKTGFSFPWHRDIQTLLIHTMSVRVMKMRVQRKF
jgi:hypothetical protein